MTDLWGEYRRKFVLGAAALSILGLIFLGQAHGEDDVGWSKETKVLATNIGGMAAITAWGVANWDYFQNSPQKGSEGWFGENTKEGGADKLAHFYTSYTLSHILSGTFDRWSYSSEKAALVGSLSTFAMMSYMEIGDSFSDYGFSREDFIMNLLGCTAGYLLYREPGLASKIDFRIEYVPDFSQADFFSDYENMKFLMAVKLKGFESVTNKYARFLEFHLGYYARGYPEDEDKERNIYMGLGISLPALFSLWSMDKTAKAFNYYQLPYTYISLDKNLNE